MQSSNSVQKNSTSVILLKDFRYSRRSSYNNHCCLLCGLITWNDLPCHLSDRDQISSPLISLVSIYQSCLSSSQHQGRDLAICLNKTGKPLKQWSSTASCYCCMFSNSNRKGCCLILVKHTLIRIIA